MEDLDKLRLFNKLKSVYRMNSVENRKESSAEHSWSSLILADYFLTRTKEPLDRLKVYELLMYHDLVEIKVGDTPLAPGVSRKEKEEKELLAAKELKKEIPQVLSEKYYALFEEFEAQITREAKFAKAIDRLDAQIHEADYKDDWNGWTKEFLVQKVAPTLEPFPELLDFFTAIVAYFEQEGYFDQ